MLLIVSFSRFGFYSLLCVPCNAGYNTIRYNHPTMIKKTLPGLAVLLALILLTACRPTAASAGLLDSTSTPTAAEATPSPTPTITPSVPPTATTSPQLSPTPIPSEHYISGIFGHRQTYAISCESSAAADWAGFFGVQVYEADIQFLLPRSDNPDKGFVGDVHDPWGQVPPYSYGVHAAPIAQALQDEYQLPARAAKPFTLEALKAEIASDQPVIAWVIGNMVGGIPADYTDKDGDTTTVAAYEHTVIITGYGEDHIRYMNNGRFYQIPTDTFLNSWGVLKNMVVYYAD